MNSTFLLWLALLGVAALAVVLYTPRRFSGPLTTHERRTAGRGRRRFSLLLTFATPLTTVAGLALLVPPPVALEVRSPGAESEKPEESAARPVLASLSWRVSTREWTESVLCHAAADPNHDLRAAILAAAHAGFRVGCNVAEALADFDAREYRSVELTLVDVAARAFYLTDVELFTGPRLRDPDPWDIMVASLRQRGIEPHRYADGMSAESSQILRLTRARVINPEIGALDTLALVRGPACEFQGRLRGDGERTLSACTLTARDGCNDPGMDPRVMWMRARCAPFTVSTPLVLSADLGEARVVPDSSIPVKADGLADALKIAGHTAAFADEIRMHDLQTFVADDKGNISVTLGETIEVRGGTPIKGHCPPLLTQGSFSWSGMPQPNITVKDEIITIGVTGTILDTLSPEYDPTAFFATLYTITWAVNSLEAGKCLKLAEPRPSASPFPAHPLLTAQQIDVAVAGIRRGAETMGLVLLALGLLSLALGLRRSVI